MTNADARTYGLPPELFASAPIGRGRPALEILPFTRVYCRGQYSVWVALEVHRLAFKLGSRRGDFMRAVRLIARAEKLDPETVKRYATRHASLVKQHAELTISVEQLGIAADGAYKSLPRDVRDALPENLSYRGLLALAKKYREV